MPKNEQSPGIDFGDQAERVYTRIAFWYELGRYNPLHLGLCLQYADALGTWLTSIAHSAGLANPRSAEDFRQIDVAQRRSQEAQKLIGQMEIGGRALHVPDWPFTPERMGRIAETQASLPLDWLAVNCPNSGHYLAVAPEPELTEPPTDALAPPAPEPNAPEPEPERPRLSMPPHKPRGRPRKS